MDSKEVSAPAHARRTNERIHSSTPLTVNERPLSRASPLVLTLRAPAHYLPQMPTEIRNRAGLGCRCRADAATAAASRGGRCGHSVLNHPTTTLV